MRALALVLVSLIGPNMALAQDRAQSLADIRQDLNVLYVEIQRLKQELSTTGSPRGTGTAGSVLDRVGALETQLQRLTGATETLELRIDQIVADGTRRIADLEFRLVELEGGDISQLGETTTLGGDIALPAPQPAQPGAELAVGERADFDAAKRVFDDGRYQEAADMLARFSQTYPNSPLAAQALLIRGKSFDELQDHRASARAYLEGFTNYGTSDAAPEMLTLLGMSLTKLGQNDAGCQTLRQVGIRFPQSEFAAQSAQIMSELACQ